MDDVETAPSSLTLSATSSNIALVPLSNITFGGSGANRTVTVTPAANQFGTTTITVTVSDGSLTASDTFVLTVNSVNDAPSFTKGMDQTVNKDAGQQFATNWATNISVGPTNESDQTLEFLVTTDNDALFSELPAISHDGTLTYTPAPNASGLAIVAVRIRDSGGTENNGTDTSALQTFMITVIDPPVLASPGNKSGNEMTLLALTLTATDNDIVAGEDDAITYSISVGIQTGMTLDAQTGAFSWTPTEEQDGEYVVAFRATDKHGLFSEQTITITVNEVNDPPVWDNPGNKTLDEKTELSFSLIATDGDIVAGVADTVTYSIVTGSLPGMTLNAATGAFSWIPTEAQDGEHLVVFRAKDNHDLAGTDQTVTITVREVNGPPVLTNPGNKTLDEKTELSFSLTATDEDIVAGVADTVTYSIVAGSVPGMTLNTATGAFSWTPTELQDGEHVVVFRAKDNHDLAGIDQTVTITVTEINDPPVLTNPGNKALDEKTALSFSLVATDGDIVAGVVDTVTYSIVDGSLLGMTLNTTTGAFNWIPTEALDGEHVVVFRASDNHDLAGTDQTITITVREVNDPPVLTNPGNKTLDEKTELNFSLTAIDGDIVAGVADTVTYSIVSGSLPGMTLNAATGVFSWIPTEMQDGLFAVTFRANDNEGAFHDQTVTITVRETNDFAPLVEDATLTLDENSPVGTAVGTVNASDEDFPSSLTYEIVSVDPSNPFAIDAATGAIAVSDPTLLDRESTAAFTVHVRVTDNGVPAKSGTGIVTVQLNDLNEFAPVAVDDAYETDEDTVLVVESPGLLKNDLRGDATETLSVTAFNGVSQLGASVTIDAAGGLRYDPRIPALQTKGRGETFVDTITYQLEDGQGSTATGTVTITIQGVNDWHNPALPLDVNRNGTVEPLDALIIINYLNANGPGRLPGRVDAPEFYYDTDDDGFVSPLDVLLIFNRLNSLTGSGEGETSPIESTFPASSGSVTSLFAEPPTTDGVGFQSHPSRIGHLVWPSRPTEARLWERAGLLHAHGNLLGPTRPSVSELTDASTGRELRAARLLDAVFADEDGLLEALDYLMLSDLGPFEK